MTKKTCDTSKAEARDKDFKLNLNDDGTWSNGQIHNVLLCDLRRELKTLNEEIRQLAIATREQLRVLKGIRKNTYKRRRRKKKST